MCLMETWWTGSLCQALVSYLFTLRYSTNWTLYRTAAPHGVWSPRGFNQVDRLATRALSVQSGYLKASPRCRVGTCDDFHGPLGLFGHRNIRCCDHDWHAELPILKDALRVIQLEKQGHSGRYYKGWRWVSFEILQGSASIFRGTSRHVHCQQLGVLSTFYWRDQHLERER